MESVTLFFCRTHHWSSPVLRSMLWSPWAHVAIIMGDEHDVAVEATVRGGVQRTRVSELYDRASHFAIVNVPVPNAKAACDFAREQVGKPYDLLGAMGIGLHRNWQDDDKWFCSELAEACIAKGGNRRFRLDYDGRITPQHSWMVSPLLRGA